MSRYRVLVSVALTLSAALWASACGDGITEPTPSEPPGVTTLAVTPATVPTPSEPPGVTTLTVTPATVPTPSEPPGVTTLTVTPATVELSVLGETTQLAAAVRDQSGRVMAGIAVTWSSSAVSVATVDALGLVAAVGNGAATITANAGSASGTARVAVAQEVRAVTVSPAADTVVVGDTLRLAAEAVDANGHVVQGAELLWAAGDTLVAVVDDAGLVTGIGAGDVKVTATAAGIAGRADLTVLDPAPTTVGVTPDTVALTALGQSEQLAAEVRDQSGRVMAGTAVTWSSSAVSVATVDASGLVAAVGNGAATITANAGGASATAVVRVIQSPDSVAVSPAEVTVAALGDALRLAAEAFDSNGHTVAGAEFSWQSSDDAVATVHESGLVTAVGNGTAVVTAASGAARGTATVVVAQTIAAVRVQPARLGPAQAGKQGARIVAAALDSGGSPVAGAAYRWSIDRRSGWVHPPEGTTSVSGLFRTTWVAGWPGEGTLSVTVENEFSRVTRELATLSTIPANPPAGAAYIEIRNSHRPSAGYSIDMTPLAEPPGTYFAAISWDGGYTGLQRGGDLYDRQLQFSVWDTPRHGDAELIDNASDVVCTAFGGEGTGVKCALDYPWKLGSTYRFEVTAEEMNGGSAITLHVTDLAAGSRRFVGTIRFARSARFLGFAMFVEDFVVRAPHCLTREARSAAIRRPMAWINGAWVAIDDMALGYLGTIPDDPNNPGTPGCANFAVRKHAAGLELVIGGEMAHSPYAPRSYTVPTN